MDDFTYQLKATFQNLLTYVPDILKVILVLFIGWLIARGISRLVTRLFRKTGWDEKFLHNAVQGSTDKFIGKLVYYLIMIIVLMIALEMMGATQVLLPLNDMIHEVFTFIPNLLAAGILGFIGYLLATFLSNLVSIGGNLLDKLVETTGIRDTDKIVSIIRQIVFVVVFIPFIIFALDALNLDAISRPANNILAEILNIIPDLIAAAAIIALFIIGGKFLARLLESLLVSLGTNEVANKLSLDKAIGQRYTLSKIISNVAYFFLAFFGIITGVEILGLYQLTEILNNLLEISGQIIFGVLILVIGNFISKLISDILADNKNSFLSTIVRVATMGLFLAMALRAMDIAPDIVNLAFGLTLGSVAVVVALAYGLGGREAAGEHFREILKKFKQNDTVILDDKNLKDDNNLDV